VAGGQWANYRLSQRWHQLVTTLAQKTTPIDWRTRFGRYLALTDLLVLMWVVFAVQIAWFPGGGLTAKVGSGQHFGGISYVILSIGIIATWWALLSIFGSRGERVLGSGADEYRLIADSSLRLFGLIAIVAFLFQLDLARGYILVALPVGIATLLMSRWMWRQWLGFKRLSGEFSARVLLVGSPATIAVVLKELHSRTEAGYLVVGACIPNGLPGTFLEGSDVPVMGGLDSIVDSLEQSRADTALVTSSGLGAEGIRELSWSLEPGQQHLVLSSSLLDIGGPRLHTRPVAGLPLIHVETPNYNGGRHLAKRLFDVAASAVLIVVLSPLFLFAAICVRRSSPGPVLYRQRRMGIRGTTFNMLKFRSMAVGSDTLVAGLQATAQDAGNGVLFKMKNDPRVTPVGQFLRRYSIDELPQLLNVLAGTMSLVGPRPSLESESENYEARVHRRFLVKPGLTGLWQISGRSSLTWAESVRLDLYYVENWSAMGDFMILWRTAKAVFSRDGAY
jgi:exopolysaccharide biosynthesis polyprenyl glycosylphosphotransferase